jgi:bifunctional non-homologous end joining protein LigD
VEKAEEEVTIDLAGRPLHITNLAKPLWPAFNHKPPLTKRDLCIYLIKIAPCILPHLHDRPLTLTRYPNGVQGERFYQKHITGTIPDYVKNVTLSEHGGAKREYIVCNNLATLLWLAQMANIDIHSWFSRVTGSTDLTEKPHSGQQDEDFNASFPDFIILDIDPYIYSGQEEKGAEPELNQKAFDRAREAALWLKEALDGLKLNSFVKTSGRTGLHIHVPIRRGFDFAAVHAAAKTICEFVLNRHPKDITLDWAVHRREGKIFLDYNQNVRGKTLASAYSPRPTPQATVSAPIRWDEIGRIYPTDFTITTMPDRMRSMTDPWSDILDRKSDLGGLLNLKD